MRGKKPNRAPRAEKPAAREEQEFEALLAYLRESRGFDFTGYKRNSLTRRVRKRMEETGVTTFGRYQDYLEVHPEEVPALFDTLLINVTSFFRDPEAWKYLSDEILPALVSRKSAGEPIRVWCAGCATGEEVYTAAILLAEAVGGDAYHRRVRIFATDLDDDALAVARMGAYSPKAVEPVPERLLRKYFQTRVKRHVVVPELRRAVIFGHHDLTSDAPISHVDLILCRNTLIYFNVETQSRILHRMHHALRDDGYLFLGRAELLVGHTHLYRQVARGQRVFQKLPGQTTEPLAELVRNDLAARAAGPAQVSDMLARTGPLPQVVVDPDGSLMLLNDAALETFGLESWALGRPFRDTRLSFHPVELRGPLESVAADRKPMTIPDVEHRSPGAPPRYFDVVLTPMIDSDDRLAGVSILFVDQTANHGARNEIERSKHNLQTAYEQLQASNAELETTNEEFQSTVEELEATNEELQSANEELETTNEELQSTNEELHSMNEELGHRNEEMRKVAGFMQALLGGLSVGIVALDRRLRVQSWNQTAEDMWGLRAEEVVGRQFLELGLGLPVKELKALLRTCLDGKNDKQSVTLESGTPRGDTIHYKVTCTLFRHEDTSLGGAILVMEEVEG